MTAPLGGAGCSTLWLAHPATNVRAINERWVLLDDPHARALRLARSAWRVLRAFDRPSPIEGATSAVPGASSATLASVMHDLISRGLIVPHPLVLRAEELDRVESMRRPSPAPRPSPMVAQRMMALAQNDANRLSREA